ncbi:MAG: hypothetical protein QOG80_3186, partial [Pseudonocardiales bacterium]|nr:hypothetical protein [Pseudonocardiales bacterium]
PTCPRWRVRNLLGHLGGVHRWAATHVREGKAAVADGTQPALEKPPDDGLVDWFVEGHRALVATLRAAPASIDAWTFLPAPSPLAFWARRQAHETAIHRADAESALGRAATYDAEFALDGLAELITGFWGRKSKRLVADPARSLLIVPTDAELRWHIAILPDARLITAAPPFPQADCTVSATASELYLLMWNRLPENVGALTGDEAVLRLWRERARIQWS